MARGFAEKHVRVQDTAIATTASNIKTKPLSVHNPPEEEAKGKASKSKAKAKAKAILAKAKATAARAKKFEKAFDKGKAKAKTKAEAKAKTKAGSLEPNVSSMQEDIASLFDTVQVYRDWLKSIQDRVFKLEGAVLDRRT